MHQREHMNKSSENSPLVTVIVPCYNHEQYITQSIESIYEQHYKNFELLVFDDGSTDNSANILKHLSKTYGFYFESHKNMGLARTLNKAIAMSKGKYITFLASDDLMLPNKLETLIKAMEELDETYAIVCGNALFMDDDSNTITLEKHGKQFSTFIEYYTSNRTDINIHSNFGTYATLLSGNYLPAMSTLYRKQALESVALFTEDIPIEDWDIYMKISKKYNMKYVDTIVAKYRWHDSNNFKVNKSGMNIGMLKILEKEREYAISRGYRHIWLKTYANRLILLFRFKEYRNIFKYIHCNDILGLSLHFLKNINKLRKETVYT